MVREEWIAKRANQLRRQMNVRIELAERNGWPNHDNDDCCDEDAEEEWNQIYGYPHDED